MKEEKYHPIYKKVDRSMLEGLITFPKRLYKEFQARKPLRLHTSRHITILWDKKRYTARLNHSSTAHTYLQIRYGHNPDLLRKFRKTFIQSYVILKSQKELYDVKAKTDDKQFRSKLTGGQQEVLIVQPIDPETVKFSVFIRIVNDWNALFQRLADENVFAWLFDKEKKYLISRSTDWTKVKEFSSHKHKNNVIYYLAHTKKKLLYIGKAETLGARVKPGQKHQEMPGDWDCFRYDLIKPEFSNILERIEDHTIRVFASIMRNDKNYSSLNITPYKLVNRKWDKL